MPLYQNRKYELEKAFPFIHLSQSDIKLIHDVHAVDGEASGCHRQIPGGGSKA